MSNSTTSLQSNSSGTHQTRKEIFSSMVNGNQTLTTGQKLSLSSDIELNGENFIILPMNGQRASFKNNKPSNNALMGGKISAYKANKEMGNEVNEASSMLLMSAMFPLGGLLDAFKHVMEGVKKIQDDASIRQEIKLDSPINLKVAVDPNQLAKPNQGKSIFTLPSSEEIELWKKKRKKLQEEKSKKIQIKGLSGV